MSYWLRLSLKGIAITTVFWLIAIGAGMIFVMRAMQGGRGMFGSRGGPSGGGGGGGMQQTFSVPLAAIGIGLAIALIIILLKLWRTRVIIDALGITHRGLWRTRRMPSERISRISLQTARGMTSCIVEGVGESLRLSLDLRDHRTGLKLADVLVRTMPDKITPELRKLAQR